MWHRQAATRPAAPSQMWAQPIGPYLISLFGNAQSRLGEAIIGSAAVVAVTIVAYVRIRVAAPFASPRAISTSCGRAYQAGCSMSTGGRSRTSSLARLSRIPSSASVTALIGMATSLRPHRCPSWRST